VLRDECVSLFLGLTFCVLVGVSTTIFKTFQCMTYGDDPVSYLIVDQSIDCSNASHRRYMVYSTGMCLVYPVGIPVLYTWLLFSKRRSLLAQEREDNHSLHKIGFLWDSYVKECWWFEIFECLRRLSLTGVLAFVAPGSPSQIVFALLLALLSIAMYTHLKPFDRDQDNSLAIVSQWSIFFTLFAALLKKMKVDEEDHYDQNLFGLLLIVVNLMGVALVGMKLLVKPFRKLIMLLNEKHEHDAELLGIGAEHDELKKFNEYAERLLRSTVEEACWLEMTNKCWGGGGKGKTRKEVDQWLEETGSVGQWRCSTGDGAVDQFRLCVEIPHTVDEVFEASTSFNEKFRKPGTDISIVADNTDGTIDYTRRQKMPWPLCAREFTLRRYAKKRDDGTAVIISRSVKREEGEERSYQLGRVTVVRGSLPLAAYLLEPGGTFNENTKLSMVVTADFGGWMLNVDSMLRKIGTKFMRNTADTMVKLRFDEEEEGGEEDDSRSSSFLGRSRGWLRAVSSASGMELGGGKKKKSSVLLRPPSGALGGGEKVTGLREGGIDIEMVSANDMNTARVISNNPLRGGGISGGGNEGKKGNNDRRHLDRVISGGFKASRGTKKTRTGPGRRRVESFAEVEVEEETEAEVEVDEVLSPPLPPVVPVAESVSKVEFEKHADPDSGQVYWENLETGKTQWEDPHK